MLFAKNYTNKFYRKHLKTHQIFEKYWPIYYLITVETSLNKTTPVKRLPFFCQNCAKKESRQCCFQYTDIIKISEEYLMFYYIFANIS